MAVTDGARGLGGRVVSGVVGDELVFQSDPDRAPVNYHHVQTWDSDVAAR